MPESAGYAIHEADIDDLLEMLRRYRRGDFTRRDPRQKQPAIAPAHSRLCVLLDDLDVVNGSPAELLRRENIAVNPKTDAWLARVMDVRVVGTPEEDPGDISLAWSGKPDVVFSAESTAREVYDIARPLLGSDLIDVSLGSREWNGQTYHPMRWRFTVTGSLAQSGPDVVSDGLNGVAVAIATWNYPYVGTGHVFPVWSAIPCVDVGLHTRAPVSAGSQVGCRLFQNVGWCVTEPEVTRSHRIRFEFVDYEDESGLVANVNVVSDSLGPLLGEATTVTDASGNFFGDETEAALLGRSGWASLVEYEDVGGSRGFRFEVDSLDCPPA